jgi:NAD(P)-dependent dehydrogenase (short-subunit alcohol dehydrogenase family)
MQITKAKGTPAFWVYGATKAAIRNFVRAWILELDALFTTMVGYPELVRTDRQSVRPLL